MKLVSLEREEEDESTSPMYPAPTLYLDMETLEALGFTELPPAGSSFNIEARAIVRRASTEDPDADGDVDHATLELQITELGLEQQGGQMASRAKAAAKLYGGDKDADNGEDE